MTDFSKKSETKKYFDSILNDLKQSKIKSIFSLSSPHFGHSRKTRTYSTDTEIYVLLENNYCLIIDYRFIDELEVQFRELTSEEKEQYCTRCEQGSIDEDFFNTVTNSAHLPFVSIDEKTAFNLDYGHIIDISLSPVKNEYSKWFKEGLDYAFPTEETFDEIKFTMSNGKSFVICADDAEVDGYTLFWSEDAIESIIETREDTEL